MALQHDQHQEPDTTVSRLAADTGIPDAVLTAGTHADRVIPGPRGRRRDARRPVSMPLGMGRARQGIDRVLAVMAPPREEGRS